MAFGCRSSPRPRSPAELRGTAIPVVAGTRWATAPAALPGAAGGPLPPPPGHGPGGGAHPGGGVPPPPWSEANVLGEASETETEGKLEGAGDAGSAELGPGTEPGAVGRMWYPGLDQPPLDAAGDPDPAVDGTWGAEGDITDLPQDPLLPSGLLQQRAPVLADYFRLTQGNRQQMGREASRVLGMVSQVAAVAATAGLLVQRSGVGAGDGVYGRGEQRGGLSSGYGPGAVATERVAGPA
ncbi:hypothetical protein PLESTM_000304200 [Pleodorina starrii]|nr:hypothetical protein PLESTM_000304200 [Pleodorina starrii]